ncbi:MAG: FAD-binding protein, partial [Clostridiales bacterium]|nr:FAD-binding protein [Clostridiales bacterium]
MSAPVFAAAGFEVPVHTHRTVVVGTGAAGYNAADSLFDQQTLQNAEPGRSDVVIVTEGVSVGTSRNTGSDKQTYYKLTLAGGGADSVGEMARTLFSGQCVDGDIALCEAALSAQSFYKLVSLGLAFPKNRYGEYVGYKTDHDPRQRATSVGPYTSRRMTECLQASVERKGIPVYDRALAVRILTGGGRVYGLLCLDLAAAAEGRAAFFALNCENIILATGGPAGMYQDSVYPPGHHGSSGLAFEAGAQGRNLTEWQYGLASKAPRWNVSGTYMQALPRFLSTDADGGDAREFLPGFFADTADMLTKVFLKGYQWPFDVSRLAGGSSIIDILVYLEIGKGRRVFLDFRENPLGRGIDFSALGGEARAYLEKAGACFGKPIDRLARMNRPAVDFYLERGVDLRTAPLEIALCAQHNNGGVAVDCWWRSGVSGLFAAGEAAATHGVYRPGGSALNAGQAGSLRAALSIAAKRAEGPARFEDFCRTAGPQIEAVLALANTALARSNPKTDAMSAPPADAGSGPHADAGFVSADAGSVLMDTAKAGARARARMSAVGAAIRNADGIRAALAAVQKELASFSERARAESPKELPGLFLLRDMLISQFVYLSAFDDYIKNGGKSRGSALYTDPDGKKPHARLPDLCTFTLDDGSRGGFVQEVS